MFYVQDLAETASKLKARAVCDVGEVMHSHIGDLARFEAPTGHFFYLYTPSPGALKWPVGLKLQELISPVAV